jgi:hypothetical protein
VTAKDGTAATGRVGRRWVRPRNGLRRTSDRIQAWLAFLLLTTMVLAAPFAAWSIAGRTYRGETRAEDWERAHRFLVTAQLLRDAPEAGDQAGDATPARPSRGTLARWTGPDESVHTGLVVADFGSRLGSSVPIWVDDQGTLTGSPVNRNPTLDALMASLLTLGLLGAALYGLHRLAVWRLDRRRLRRWEQEWLVVEPRWTHR